MQARWDIARLLPEEVFGDRIAFVQTLIQATMRTQPRGAAAVSRVSPASEVCELLCAAMRMAVGTSDKADLPRLHASRWACETPAQGLCSGQWVWGLTLPATTAHRQGPCTHMLFSILSNSSCVCKGRHALSRCCKPADPLAQQVCYIS